MSASKKRRADRLARAAGLLLVASTAACSQEPARVQLVFPSQTLAEATASVEVQVFVGDATVGGGPCAALGVEETPDPPLGTALFDRRVAFPFEGDDLQIHALPDGIYIFSAAAFNRGSPSRRFLTGCTALGLKEGEDRSAELLLAEFRGCCGKPGCSPRSTFGCYDGAATTLGKGACRAGEARCQGGYFRSCEGQVLPATESCNRIDDDCDGIVDDVAPNLLENDQANCGACGRVCRSSCAAGVCDQTLDTGAWLPDARVDQKAVVGVDSRTDGLPRDLPPGGADHAADHPPDRGGAPETIAPPDQAAAKEVAE
jgi:hypothetical protein